MQLILPLQTYSCREEQPLVGLNKVADFDPAPVPTQPLP